jgi:hypothetical protein
VYVLVIVYEIAILLERCGFGDVYGKLSREDRNMCRKAVAVAEWHADDSCASKAIPSDDAKLETDDFPCLQLYIM